MDEFDKIVKDVKKECSLLLKSPKYRMDKLPKEMPLAGIYIFYENDTALYVGRTNKMKNRLKYYTNNSHNQATFAFRIAGEKTGKKATYRKEGSRKNLLEDDVFKDEFDNARDRIRKMDVQFIEEADPNRQAVLEICTTLRVKAIYNDFDNH